MLCNASEQSTANAKSWGADLEMRLVYSRYDFMYMYDYSTAGVRVLYCAWHKPPEADPVALYGGQTEHRKMATLLESAFFLSRCMQLQRGCEPHSPNR